MKRFLTLTGALTCCLFPVFCLSSCKGQPAASRVSQLAEDDALPSNVAKYSSQGFETYWIGDNAEERKNNVSLFPGVTGEIVEELNLQDGAPASMSAFLIKADGRNLLFDTGMGAPNSLLLPSLAAVGVAPEQVSAIFLTHLHGDHTGGLSKDGIPVFPNATVYISNLEYEQMDGERILEPYKGKVVRFDFGDELCCGVQAVEAVGHTPGHTCYLKGDVLIAGDIMHAVALQMARPEFCATYDRAPGASVAVRIRMVGMAKEKKLLLCGMHFPSGGAVDYRE